VLTELDGRSARIKQQIRQPGFHTCRAFFEFEFHVLHSSSPQFPPLVFGAHFDETI
jgi:hypothetical protein